MVFMADVGALAIAETQGRAAEDLTTFTTGSMQSDLLSAGLFLLMAYALLAEQNVALFTLGFLAFAFTYNPVRVRTGSGVFRSTENVI